MSILNPASATSLSRCSVAAAENEPPARTTNAISWILFYLSSISEKIFDPGHFILCSSGGTNQGQLAGATPSRSPLSQYPRRCLVNNLSRITDKCSFIRIHVISPDI